VTNNNYRKFIPDNTGGLIKLQGAITVEYCTIKNHVGDVGIWFDHDDGNSIVRNNLIENNTVGILCEVKTNGYIYNNVITCNQAGVELRGARNVRVYNNTIENTSYAGAGIWIENSGADPNVNNTIEQNILDNRYIKACDILIAGDYLAGTIDRNCYWRGTAGEVRMKKGSVFYTALEGPRGWRNATSFDATSQVSDPLFSKRRYQNEYDFHIRRASPLVNAGFPINQVTNDYAGLERSGHYSIGAYRGDPNLVAFYPNDQEDWSEYGNNGTSIPNVGKIPGRAGPWALSFDGRQYISVPGSGVLNAKNSVTVMGLFNISASSADKVGVEKRAPNGQFAYRLLATKQPTNTWLWRFEIHDSVDQLRSIEAPVAYAAISDKWHHVAGLYDGGYLRLYVDGREANSIRAPGTILSSTDPLEIGRRDGSAYYKGFIDELKIYDRAVSANEVVADSFAR
jgi:hypothetical protein